MTRNHTWPGSGAIALLLVAFLFTFGLAGCSTSSTSAGEFAKVDLTKIRGTNAIPSQAGETIRLKEGDVIKLTFAGAPNLNTLLQVRRDKKVSPPIIDEVVAAGLTPVELEKQLMKLYEPHLISQELRVTVESSSFTVYVSGAVLRPGKVVTDRPITALEAIMEAGGFDQTRANLKGVTITRTADGDTEHFKVDLRSVLKGKTQDTFQLKPSDIVHVPERFQWF